MHPTPGASFVRVSFSALFSLAILLGVAAAWASPPSIAVNDFSARGVTPSDAAIIGDRLRSVLIATGRVRVLERSQMDQILKEQAFSQSGGCDQSECAVQIGKLLSVDRMIVGSVGKIGEMYTLQARVLKVSTGEIVYSTSQDFEGRVEGMLTQALPVLARQLATGALVEAPPQGKGDLYVKTSAVGASIAVDGVVQKGVSPMNLEGLESGSHVLTAVLGTQFGTTTVDVVPDELKKVRIEMATGTGGLKIVSEPMGAEVTLDGTRNLGETPIRIGKDIPAGEHTLKFTMKDHLGKDLKVLVEIGKTVTVSPVLDPSATLVASIPAGSKARISNDSLEYVLTAKDSTRDLPVGKWTVWVEHPDFEVFQQAISLKQGAVVRFAPSLTPRFGSIQLSSNQISRAWVVAAPSVGRAERDGDSLLGDLPLHRDHVPPGELRLRISGPDAEDTIVALHVERAMTTTLKLVLLPRFGSLDLSANLPSQGWLLGDGGADSALGNLPIHRIRIPPGELRLRVAGQDLVDTTFSVIVERGRSSTASLCLHHSMKWQDDSLAQFRHHRRSTWRVLTGIGAVGLAAVALNEYGKAQDLEKDSQRSLTDYGTATSGFESYKSAHAKALDDANAAYTRSLLSAVGAGILAAGFTLTYVY